MMNDFWTRVQLPPAPPIHRERRPRASFFIPKEKQINDLACTLVLSRSGQLIFLAVRLAVPIR